MIEFACDGKRVNLRQVIQSDSAWLYRLATQDSVVSRWRLRGRQPSPEAFEQLLWGESDVQALVETKQHRPLGLVQIFAYQPRNAVASMAILIDPAFNRLGWPLEAGVLVVQYAFEVMGLRKLYVSVPEHNFDQLEGLTSFGFETEAVLEGIEYAAGRWWTVHLLAVTRATWNELGPLVSGLQGVFGARRELPSFK